MRKLTDQEQARQEKLDAYRAAGNDPFPARVKRTHRLNELRKAFTKLERERALVAVVGRTRAIRLHGGSFFVDLDDGNGRLQCFVTSERLGPAYNLLANSLDIGDFLEIEGSLFTTKRGEQTIQAHAARIVVKALRPLPEKWHGLSDVETRFRHRELDLIANETVRDIFETRGKILALIRDFLARENFLEVETPVLQHIPGGANARPFETHHHALDINLYLRIAPELYLKRLVIGGFERIFEIARCFRNEGIDHEHNPEFTQVELYAASTDYRWMMELCERMMVAVTAGIHGKPECTYQKKVLRFKPPFARVLFHDALKKYSGIDIEAFPDTTKLSNAARKKGIELSAHEHRGKVLDELFKTFVRPAIMQPTFVIDHPIELSPLAKKKADDPRYVERFQLIVAGTELCNAFSELNDPVDQRSRFEAQEQLRRAGYEEAQRIDEEFLEALEYGMPPTAGLGIGIDRLVMILTNSRSLKEVIAFPTLKPRV